MRFGPTPVEDALGHKLAHGLKRGSLKLPKGHRLTAADLAGAKAAGLEMLTTVALGPDDLDEDEAAERLGRLIAARHLTAQTGTGGRINWTAACDGLLTVEPAVVDRFNAIDEALTLATLPSDVWVTEGERVASLKIIPFAIASSVVTQGQAVLRTGRPFQLHARRMDLTAVLVQTRQPDTAERLLAKSACVQAKRLAPFGATMTALPVADHTVPALTEAIFDAAAQAPDLILIEGAVAICDRHDVLPSALLAAGGQVLRYGMPTEPGNLILLGHVRGHLVIGLPGCARSPALNGLDRVLARWAAGLPVAAEDLLALGVGGLLAPRPGRARRSPHADAVPNLAALLLAAGSSNRMGGPNKLLLPWRDDLSLVEASAAAADTLPLRQRLAVLSRDADRVAPRLAPLGFDSVINRNSPTGGQASSLVLGLSALDPTVDAVLVMLGDMPSVRPDTLSALTAAFRAAPQVAAVQPVHGGRRGNPVLIARRLFAQLMQLTGDQGARGVLSALGDDLILLPVDDPGILTDIDDPDSYADQRAKAG